MKVGLASMLLAGACSSGNDQGTGGAGGAGGMGGAGGGTTTPVTVTVMRNDNPPYVQANDDAFKKYTDAHTNVTITSNTLPYPSLTSTLLADLKTGKDTADLIFVPPSWVCTFASQLTDVPADVISLADARNAFYKAPLDGSTCSGVLKGLPQEYNLEYGGVVVNVDKFQKLHPGATPTWSTWADFIGDAGKLTEYDGTTPKANGLDIAPDWPQPVKHIFFSQILQRGGTYWAADKKTFDFKDSQEARATLTEMVSWVNTAHVMFTSLIPAKNTFVTTRLAGGATGVGWGDPAKPLSVMGYCGSWGLPNTVGQLPAGSTVKYSYAALPPMVGSEHKFVQNSGFAWVVPKTAKNPKVAWEIAKLLTLDAATARKWTTTGGALPALKANGTAELAASDPVLAQVQPLFEKGEWVGYIPADAIETVEGGLVSGFFDAVKGPANGGKSIPDALKGMQDAANAALAGAAK